MRRTILEILDQIPDPGSAGQFQKQAAAALLQAGFQVQVEVPIRYPNKGFWRGSRKGRLDLVVDGWYAVELDRRSPRRRSRAKIAAFGDGLVYCREGRPQCAP